jgi:hypothetical protein
VSALRFSALVDDHPRMVSIDRARPHFLSRCGSPVPARDRRRTPRALPADLVLRGARRTPKTKRPCRGASPTHALPLRLRARQWAAERIRMDASTRVAMLACPMYSETSLSEVPPHRDWRGPFKSQLRDSVLSGTRRDEPRSHVLAATIACALRHGVHVGRTPFDTPRPLAALARVGACRPEQARSTTWGLP